MGDGADLLGRLTTQERRIALSVGQGSTNKAIARELGVSAKTVEFHLANAYRKLGVANRGELSHLLRALAAEAPTGTVTFLYLDVSTEDVVVSTRRVGDLLDACRTTMDRIVVAAGGFSCHLGLDGLGAAFGSPVVAAAVAVDCQVAASALGVRPRTAIHTGLAEVRAGVYVGAAVRRASALASIANGGQVLVSAAAAAVLLDEEWSLIDMGWQPLDGDAREEQVHRLCAADLDDVALPLRRASQSMGNLPAGRGRLVGRSSEIGEIPPLLDVHRFVTITGTGGVGKTRVAVAAARAVGERFAQGVWMVELGHVLRDRAIATSPWPLQRHSGSRRMVARVPTLPPSCATSSG